MGTARFETLVDYAKREVDVGIRCDGCRRTRYLTVAQLGDIFGLGTRRTTIERRLRCVECGHKGAALVPVPQLETKPEPICSLAKGDRQPLKVVPDV